MFRLRIRMLVKQGKEDIATAHLEGAWRALCETIGERDAAILILRSVYPEHWNLTPSGMRDYILELFHNDHIDIVPGANREQAGS